MWSTFGTTFLKSQKSCNFESGRKFGKIYEESIKKLIFERKSMFQTFRCHEIEYLIENIERKTKPYLITMNVV